MMTLKKLAALLALLTSEAWLLWNPKGWEFKWDALAACFTTLLALLLLERNESQSGQGGSEYPKGKISLNAPHPNDIALFKEFLTVLSPTEVIDFFRHHDFSGSFTFKNIEQLRHFVSDWKNPDKEFISKELEVDRRRLLEEATKLSSLIARNTAPIQHDVYSVKPRDLIGPIPDWIKEEAENMNTAATNFVAMYDEFVRKCRASLPLIGP